jgi:uncharacterized membrane protein
MRIAQTSTLLLRQLGPRATLSPGAKWPRVRAIGDVRMRRLLLILGLVALAIGLLWIGQGTGTIDWPQSSFMIRQLQWAGYGAALAAVGLILIWQSKR